MKLITTILLMFSTLIAGAQDTIPVAGTTAGTITTLTYNWTSDGSGNAVGVTAEAVPGVIFSATTQASAAAQPTNLYDVVVYEQFTRAGGGSDVVDSSDDLLDGLLADRPNTTGAVQTVRVLPNTVTTTVGKIRIQISNAGASKQGTVTLQIGRGWYIKRGESSIPMTGGSSGQILQYQGPGQSKFVTMSGGATIADGGAVTLNPNPIFNNVTVDTLLANTSIEIGDFAIDSSGSISSASPITTTSTVSAAHFSTVQDASNFVTISNNGNAIFTGQVDMGGGYGSTGVTVNSSGNLSANGTILADLDLQSTRFFSLGSSTGGGVTISAGVLSPSRSNQQVDTEGAAASDDLDTITATSLRAGTFLILQTVSAARDVTIKNGTGNILCFGGVDIVLVNEYSRALLVWNPGQSVFTATQLY